MVDIFYFRKINPNYVKPHLNELAKPSSSDGFFIIFSDTESDDVKGNAYNPNILSEDDLIICSQTVYN